MRPPRFSVLLPTHNRPDTLRLAIQSALGQTLDSFELLVVGDGCTDETGEVVRRFEDPRVQFFDLPKAPYFGYANRNVVLRRARGEHVAYLAHDDLWFPDHLELLYRRLEDGAEWVHSRPLWVTPDGTILPVEFNLGDPETLEAFLGQRRNAIFASCVAHHRSCLDRYGYWNEAVPQAADLELWARIIEGGGRARFSWESLPTSLHFRAIWRAAANAGPPELDHWAAWYERHPSLTAALRNVVPPGSSEQEVLWARIAAGGWRGSDQIRTAIGLVLDARISTDRDRIRELEGTLQRLRGEKEKLARRLDQLQATRGWRLLERLRAVRRAIQRRGRR